MSRSALKQAAVSRLNTVLIDTGRLTGAECRLTPSAKPVPPYAGGMYLSVHGGRSSGRRLDYSQTITVGFDVTVSMMLANIPQYKRGERLDALTEGMDNAQALIVRALLSRMGIDLVGEANVLIAADSLFGAFQPGIGMYFAGSGDDEARNGDWFNRTMTEQTVSPIVGYSRTLRFDGATLYADNSDMQF